MDVALKLFSECKEIFESIELTEKMSKSQAIESCKKLQNVYTNISRILTRTVIAYDLTKKE